MAKVGTTTRRLFSNCSNNTKKADASLTTYSLLELPKELLSLCETWTQEQPPPFEIKGEPNDDTYLVTQSKTYAIKAVRNSNTLLVCLPKGQDGLEVVATHHQTLEVTASRPRTERISFLLEGQEFANDDKSVKSARAQSKRLRRYEKSELVNLIQASEAEITQAFKAKRVVEVNGYVRPVAKNYLVDFLSGLLLVLATSDDTSLQSVIRTIAQDLELEEDIAAQMIELYLLPNAEDIDVPKAVHEIGRLLLQVWSERQKPGYKPRTTLNGHRCIPMADFLTSWKALAGDEAEHFCEMEALQGSCITESANIMPITVSDLSLDPPTRFNYLFKLKPKWPAEEIILFLDGIGVDLKDQERWLLKCARKVKEGSRTNYVARTTT